MPIPYKKLKNLEEVQNLQDSDITIIEDQNTTRKGTLRQLVQYLKWHDDINTYYAHQETVGAADGIAPLDENTKLPSANLNFGNAAGTVFEGCAGKNLEDSLNTHKADTGNPHATTKAQVGLGNVTNESKAVMFTSPVFTGIPTAPTAEPDSNDGQLANTEYVSRAIANGIAASDAMIFKGTLGTGGTITALPSAYLTGWTYRVITPGTYAGQTCETGDLIIALTDRNGSGSLPSDWTVCQTNIDGAVIETRKINAGNGLTGGGSLSADRTLHVGAGNGISVAADSVAAKPDTTGISGSVGKTVVNADGIGVALGSDGVTAFPGDLGKQAYDHSLAAHARTDAAKTEASSVNGNIKINGTETPVYRLPDDAAVTASERTNWNDANTKKHVHANKDTIDKITQATLDKLSGIANGAQVNVQADWNITDTASDSYIKNKPAAFPPSAHTHTKSQITDMPTKLSQFTNDAGYLTSADVDTGQNHTHANKSILDSISQPVVDKWNTVSDKVDKETGKGLSSNDFTTALLGKLNGIDAEANKYTHPSSGVTTGTYKSVTVNAQGHVTGGTNPATLAGYGITDAAAKSHTHNYAGSDTPGGAAASAARLSANRTISLTGDVTGSASTNLSGDVSITTTLSGGATKEKISATEPSGLSVNNYWLQEY